eukprot:COSAG06_NODE_4396_length_4300_cov_24.967151_5_plen_163_part_00
MCRFYFLFRRHRVFRCQRSGRSWARSRGCLASALCTSGWCLLRIILVVQKRLKLWLSGSARKSQKRFRDAPKFKFPAVFVRSSRFNVQTSAQNGATAQFESQRRLHIYCPEQVDDGDVAACIAHLVRQCLLFARHFILVRKMPSFYQDRFGANIGKAAHRKR